MDIAFRNHLIYLNIYKKLSRKDLLNLYKVNNSIIRISVINYIKYKNTHSYTLIGYFLENVSDIYLTKKYENIVDWESMVINNCQLSKELITEFKDRFNWKLVFKYRHLSEDLIREFKDKVDWELISKHQMLSEDFIVKFIN